MSYLSAVMKNLKVEEVENTDSTKNEEKNVQQHEVEVDAEKKVLESNQKDDKYVPKNKNAFRRKKSSKQSKKGSKKVKDPNYMKVLSKVQDSFLLKVLPDEKTTEKIQTNKQYMVNWSTPVYINTSEDIVETFEDKEYKFQKSRILGSRYFQNMVRELYQTKFGNVNVSFSWNKNYPDSYTIRVRD
jgi:hypothetical protein